MNPTLISLSTAMLLLVFGMATKSAAQTFAEVEKDSKNIDDAYVKFSDATYSVLNESPNGTLTEIVEVYLGMYNQIQSINELQLKQAEASLAEFKKKYGQNGDDDFSERFVEIRDNDKSLNQSGSPESVPSPSYSELKDAVKEWKEGIARKGDDLTRTAGFAIDMVDYRNDPQEVSDLIRDMVTALNLALKFNPKNQQAKDLLAKAEGIRKKKVKELEEARKTARMPKQHPDFKGDGKAVVAKALEHINNKKTNPKFNYFTGTVASPWFERVDILGRTVDYTIQVNIGYTVQGEPANVVHVYRAVVFTCGKKAEPGFCNSGVVMGWEFTMLKENLGK